MNPRQISFLKNGSENTEGAAGIVHIAAGIEKFIGYRLLQYFGEFYGGSAAKRTSLEGDDLFFRNYLPPQGFLATEGGFLN